MGPASQTKKGADTCRGETVSKGRRVTSRLVSFVIAGSMDCYEWFKSVSLYAIAGLEEVD
jgi:hypothetical protein